MSGLSPAYSSPEEYHELMEVLRLLGFTRILCPPVGVSRNDYIDMGRVSQVVSFTRGLFRNRHRQRMLCIWHIDWMYPW